MSNPDLRREAADRLRRAVVAEAYDDVETALTDYRREVEAALAAWSPIQPPPRAMVREALDLSNWALRVVRSARAHTSDKLEQVSAVLRYRALAPTMPRWKLEG
jgi:hypothetical protein